MPLTKPHPDNRQALLSAHLWDLRAQAEAKLRCLTRLQQALNELEEGLTPRSKKVPAILKDLTDIVTISKSLHDVARRALEAAKRL